MSDIVDRLHKRMIKREWDDEPLVKVLGDAADEIERQQQVIANMMIDAHVSADEIERLRAALAVVTNDQEGDLDFVKFQVRRVLAGEDKE